MATLIMETSKSAQRRRRFAIHKMQKAYAVHTGLLLFLYSSVFFVLAFFGPYVVPAITLFTTDGPLQEREIAAKELLLLSETVWVAIPVLFFGAVIFALVLTHRVAGPLHRLEQSTKAWAQGHLSWRIQFRKADQLEDLSDSANAAVGQRAVERILEGLKLDPAAQGKWVGGLQESVKALQEIDSVLTRFRFTRTR
jgi:methyl-accepting chemotaxis protein